MGNRLYSPVDPVCVNVSLPPSSGEVLVLTICNCIISTSRSWPVLPGISWWARGNATNRSTVVVIKTIELCFWGKGWRNGIAYMEEFCFLTPNAQNIIMASYKIFIFYFPSFVQIWQLFGTVSCKLDRIVPMLTLRPPRAKEVNIAKVEYDKRLHIFNNFTSSSVALYISVVGLCSFICVSTLSKGIILQIQLWQIW